MNPRFSQLFLAASAVALLASVAGAAQTPAEPLGDLLDVIPLPEKPLAGAATDAEAPRPAPLTTPSPPPVRPGAVVPIDLPPSRIIEEPAAPEISEMLAEGLSGDSAEGKAEATNAQAEADANWAAIQEQRRQAINAVEAPIVDRLNAEGAARARAEARRFEEERVAYERSLAEAQEERRRVQAEHDAEMAAYAERVGREQAEYRARVAACLDGDRRACRPEGKR
jgi:hypothetical protein